MNIDFSHSSGISPVLHTSLKSFTKTFVDCGGYLNELCIFSASIAHADNQSNLRTELVGKYFVQIFTPSDRNFLIVSEAMSRQDQIFVFLNIMEGPTIFELRLIFAPLFSQGLSKQSALLNFQQTGQILAVARINPLRQQEIRSESLNILKLLFHMQTTTLRTVLFCEGIRNGNGLSAS